MRIAATILMLALAAVPAQEPAPQPRPNGGGGDSARPKTASMIIEGEEPGAEPTPPVPQGDERKAIGEHIRDNSAEIRDCYARRLADKPTLAGKLVARFDICPNVKVIGAMADGINDRELVLCVVTAVRKWEFEKPVSGGKLRVAYPFKFEPQPAR